MFSFNNNGYDKIQSRKTKEARKKSVAPVENVNGAKSILCKILRVISFCK
jgi:hypothetical protein